MKLRNLFHLPLPMAGLLMLGWSLSPGSSLAGMPSGGWKFQISDVTNRVWNVTGIPGLQEPLLEFTEDNIAVMFNAPFAQGGSGKLAGAGATQMEVESSIYTGPVQSIYAASGSITSAKGIARLTLTSSAKGIAEIDGGPHTLSSSATIKAVINSVTQTITGTYAAKASASAYGSVKETGLLDFPYPDLLRLIGNGQWSLHLNLTNDAVKTVGGTASVALSSGHTLAFVVKGKYNTKTDSTLLILSADAASKGSSLKVNWPASGSATLQGKLTGQTVKTSAVAAPE